MKSVKLLLLAAICCTALKAQSLRNVALNKTIDEVEPLKGIVFWPGNSKMSSYGNSIALEFSYCLPSKVVTGKVGNNIQYDWSYFDALLDDIADRGHQAVIRFRYEYPGSTDVDGSTPGMTAVPAYIKALPDYHETYNPAQDDGPTYYADWSNSELQWFTKQFYTDLAARYDNDPRIAYIQVGFGHWSEYHIYNSKGTNLQLGVNFPSKAYQKEFLTHMNNTFIYTPWSISKDAAATNYTPIAGDTEIMGLNFGVFDDSFMHAGHDISQGDGYNETCWIALNSNRWQAAPAGGEFSYYTGNDQKNALNPDGMYGVTWEQAAAKYHITYMIGNDVNQGANFYGTVDRVKEASIYAGYTFEITKYQVSDTQAKVTVKNTGIAPLYHNAYVTVKGVRSPESLKGLLPGVEKEFTVNVAIAGNESPEPAITSDKILTGKTIPYKASLTGDANGINDMAVKRYIEQSGTLLTFTGSNFSVTVYDLQNRKIATTRENTLDLSAYPQGYYIVNYTGLNGERETMKIIR